MKLTGEWIEAEETQAICRMLEAAGHQTLLVGGCVRNALLGEPVNDVDIATDARPSRVMELSQAAGFKAVPTGIDHGTVTIVVHHRPFEITTFRKDIRTDGRRAVVDFADEMESDARRRDFTMNALYATREGRVIDPLGGLGDLKERRVRFIEDPVRRIREDYLRILRFFRFHAWYGDPNKGMDADGLAAAAEMADGIATLSRERIGAEILKLLAAPDPAPAVSAMQQAGILEQVLPGADAASLGRLVQVETFRGQAPDAIRRLAGLGGVGAAERLRLSRAQSARLGLLADAAAGAIAAPELGYRHGIDIGTDILLVRAALLEQPADRIDIERLQDGAGAVFPVRASDLMPGLEGVALGRKLRSLEEKWIASGFRLSREQLLGQRGAGMSD